MTHLWILTHLKGSPSVQMLLDAVAATGATADLVHARTTNVDLTSLGNDVDDRLFGTGSGIARRPDAVITRLGGSAPRQAFDLVRAIESCEIPCVNSSASIERTTDKIRSFHHLSGAGLPLPRTLSIAADGSLDAIQERLGDPPYVLKLPSSVQGLGVARVDSMSSLRSTVDLLRSREDRLIVQEFVHEAAGTDLRILVLGGHAVAAMRRHGAADEFRSNLHRGGTVAKVDITDELAELAVGASKTLGLQAAGVDLLMSARGPLIIEVNASPGLHGIQSASTVDLASRYVAEATGAAQSTG